MEFIDGRGWKRINKIHINIHIQPSNRVSNIVEMRRVIRTVTLSNQKYASQGDYPVSINPVFESPIK